MEAMIRGEFGAGFFASAPLTTHDGHDLGALCVIDHQPRAVDERQLHHLETLAELVIDRMELRLTARAAAARAEILAREVDHRAMNSLQLVASLLNLQSRVTQVPETAQQLIIASNRVLAVARVHRNFSTDESIECVSIFGRRPFHRTRGLLHHRLSPRRPGNRPRPATSEVKTCSCDATGVTHPP
ncbi:MAG: hypothetical protein EXR12_11855 [Rhodospirillaceae bacterium]|nr:hypothetical protein [Rhodospirillaceae bacterium]